MQLQQVATTWTHRIITLLVIKLVGLDISCIVVTKNMVRIDNIFSSEKKDRVQFKLP
jgi:hypothetical protein